MTLTKSDVTELLDAIRAGGDIDVICKGVELVLQALIDTEATEVIGAERYEGAFRPVTWGYAVHQTARGAYFSPADTKSAGKMWASG